MSSSFTGAGAIAGAVVSYGTIAYGVSLAGSGIAMAVDNTADLYHAMSTSGGSSGGSQRSENSWGTTDNLLDSATKPGKGGTSPVGRAFQKHAGDPNRAGSFAGEVSGNAAQNTQNGTKYLNDILSNPNSSYTVRNTKSFGEVLDVRLPDGTGARWTADGDTFIGFLERYTVK